MAPVSSFVFTLCQRGAEAALKRELTRVAPAWAPAYQRPGLVTFRAPAPLTPEVALDSVFARSWGLSLGMARSAAEALALAPSDEPLRIQVVETDLHRPDEEPPGFTRGALAGEVEALLRAEAAGRFRFGAASAPGELVLSVIVAPGDPWLVGVHRHVAGRSPHAGGRYPVQVPPEAPSRAFAKIEEALQAFALPVREGQVAVELGAAPGGAAYALVRRGISVVAVDPADMDEGALAFTGPMGATIQHLRMPMGALERSHLPERVDWLVMDVHLAPQVALRSVRKVVHMLRTSLRGVVFTLKLNDWSFAEQIPEFLTQVRELGVYAPRARQLPSHRQEIAIGGQFSATPSAKALGRPPRRPRGSY